MSSRARRSISPTVLSISRPPRRSPRPPPATLPDEADLVLVALDEARLGGALRYEPSRHGGLFPHLYAPRRSRRGALGQAAAARRRRPAPVSGARLMDLAWRLGRPLLFALEPEAAHRLSIAALKSGLHPAPPRSHERLKRRLLGLDFPNPFGIAAGYDKNGEVPDPLLKLGFGFVEVGTVTPLPQAGNPAPARLPPRSRATRSSTASVFRARGTRPSTSASRARPRRGIVGVNIGANKESADRAGDYVAGVARFADVADYIAINISSPNTPGLRDLQEKAALTGLLDRVVGARDRAARRVPLLLKIAPDLDDAALAAIAETALASGIEGMIVSNTTIARDRVRSSPCANEAGGLSGAPLFAASTDDARQAPPPRRRPPGADRRRRRRFRGERDSEGARRRRPRPALHRPRLRGPRAAGPAARRSARRASPPRASLRSATSSDGTPGAGPRTSIVVVDSCTAQRASADPQRGAHPSPLAGRDHPAPHPASIPRAGPRVAKEAPIPPPCGEGGRSRHANGRVGVATTDRLACVAALLPKPPQAVSGNARPIRLRQRQRSVTPRTPTKARSAIHRPAMPSTGASSHQIAR